MSRPVPNYDPRAEQQPTAHERKHDPDRKRYPVYLTWKARTPTQTLDYGRVYDCPTWTDAQSKARELTRMVADPNAMFPTVDAFDVQIDPGVPESARTVSDEGRQAVTELAAATRLRAHVSPDEVF